MMRNKLNVIDLCYLWEEGPSCPYCHTQMFCCIQCGMTLLEEAFIVLCFCCVQNDVINRSTLKWTMLSIVLLIITI